MGGQLLLEEKGQKRPRLKVLTQNLEVPTSPSKPILPTSTPQSPGFSPTPKQSLCTASQTAFPYGL